MKPLNFTFIGRSGCGKGTQADFLMKKFPYLKHVTTGKLFRELSLQDTDAGHRIKKDMTDGTLPFDDLATTLWMREIAYTVKEDEGILLDGAPRRVPEAKNLERFLTFLERDKHVFNIFIDISRDEAFNRLKARRRDDDTDEAINGRQDYFEEFVQPVVEFYKERGRLITINGEQSEEDVFSDICAYLDKRI